jgi:hypothetical protein
MNITSLDGDPTFTVELFMRRYTGTNYPSGTSMWGFGGTGQGNGVGGWTPTTNLIHLDAYDSTRLATAVNYPEGSWVHIVWTKNGAGQETSNVVCYINGVSTGLTKTRSATRTNQFNTSTAGVGIVLGRLSPDAAVFHGTGDIAIYRIYDRALTQQEVLQNFNAERGRFGI